MRTLETEIKIYIHQHRNNTQQLGECRCFDDCGATVYMISVLKTIMPDYRMLGSDTYFIYLSTACIKIHRGTRGTRTTVRGECGPYMQFRLCRPIIRHESGISWAKPVPNSNPTGFACTAGLVCNKTVRFSELVLDSLFSNRP